MIKYILGTGDVPKAFRSDTCSKCCSKFFTKKMQLKIVAWVLATVYNRGEKMGQKEKLIKKLMSKPKDFTFAEAETLLNYFDYVRSNKGKTS